MFHLPDSETANIPNNFHSGNAGLHMPDTPCQTAGRYKRQKIFHFFALRAIALNNSTGSRQAPEHILLTNATYTGKAAFKGTIYDGEHDGIVDIDPWQRMQDTLRRNGQTGGKAVRNKYGALLKGILYCEPSGTGSNETIIAATAAKVR